MGASTCQRSILYVNYTPTQDDEAGSNAREVEYGTKVFCKINNPN